jgi:hypothetical protein
MTREFSEIKRDDGLIYCETTGLSSLTALLELSRRMPDVELQLEYSYRDLVYGQAVAVNGNLVQERVWDETGNGHFRSVVLGHLFRMRPNLRSGPSNDENDYWPGIPFWRNLSSGEENHDEEVSGHSEYHTLTAIQGTSDPKKALFVDWDVDTCGDGCFDSEEEALRWLSFYDPAWPPCPAYSGYEVRAPYNDHYLRLRGPNGLAAPLLFVVGHEVSRLLKTCRRLNPSYDLTEKWIKDWLSDAPGVEEDFVAALTREVPY